MLDAFTQKGCIDKVDFVVGVPVLWMVFFILNGILSFYFIGLLYSNPEHLMASKTSLYDLFLDASIFLVGCLILHSIASLASIFLFSKRCRTVGWSAGWGFLSMVPLLGPVFYIILILMPNKVNNVAKYQGKINWKSFLKLLAISIVLVLGFYLPVLTFAKKAVVLDNKNYLKNQSSAIKHQLQLVRFDHSEDSKKFQVMFARLVSELPQTSIRKIFDATEARFLLQEMQDLFLLKKISSDAAQNFQKQYKNRRYHKATLRKLQEISSEKELASDHESSNWIPRRDLKDTRPFEDELPKKI